MLLNLMTGDVNFTAYICEPSPITFTKTLVSDKKTRGRLHESAIQRVPLQPP